MVRSHREHAHASASLETKSSFDYIERRLGIVQNFIPSLGRAVAAVVVVAVGDIRLSSHGTAILNSFQRLDGAGSLLRSKPEKSGDFSLTGTAKDGPYSSVLSLTPPSTHLIASQALLTHTS